MLMKFGKSSSLRHVWS